MGYSTSLTYAVLLCAVLWEVHGKTRVLSCLCCKCSDRHNCACTTWQQAYNYAILTWHVFFNYFLLLATATPSFLSCSVCVRDNKVDRIHTQWHSLARDRCGLSMYNLTATLSYSPTKLLLLLALVYYSCTVCIASCVLYNCFRRNKRKNCLHDCSAMHVLSCVRLVSYT